MVAVPLYSAVISELDKDLFQIANSLIEQKEPEEPKPEVYPIAISSGVLTLLRV